MVTLAQFLGNILFTLVGIYMLYQSAVMLFISTREDVAVWIKTLSTQLIIQLKEMSTFTIVFKYVMELLGTLYLSSIGVRMGAVVMFLGSVVWVSAAMYVKYEIAKFEANNV